MLRLPGIEVVALPEFDFGDGRVLELHNDIVIQDVGPVFFDLAKFILSFENDLAAFLREPLLPVEMPFAHIGREGVAVGSLPMRKMADALRSVAKDDGKVADGTRQSIPDFLRNCALGRDAFAGV